MKESLQCTDNFDITFTDSGDFAMVSDGRSIANMLYLDFSSNNDWSLDDRLGLNWINEENTGLLQLKNKEPLIVNEIQKKLINLDGVKDIEEIEINKTIDRRYVINAKIITFDNNEFKIGNEVI